MEDWRPIPPKDLFADNDAPPQGLRHEWRHVVSTVRWWGWGRIATVMLCVPLVGLGGYFLVRTPEAPVEASLSFATTRPPTEPTATSLTATSATAQVTVHVAGNVMAPGVYRFALGSRVVDSVRAAGGASSTADLNALNLAGLLNDGEQVYVPAIGERPPAAEANTDSAETIRLPLDLNRASADELVVLPGVGPATAAAIISHRERHGSFASVEGLLEVAGIGPAKLAALSGLITV